MLEAFGVSDFKVMNKNGVTSLADQSHCRVPDDGGDIVCDGSDLEQTGGQIFRP